MTCHKPVLLGCLGLARSLKQILSMLSLFLYFTTRWISLVSNKSSKILSNHFRGTYIVYSCHYNTTSIYFSILVTLAYVIKSAFMLERLLFFKTIIFHISFYRIRTGNVRCLRIWKHIPQVGQHWTVTAQISQSSGVRWQTNLPYHFITWSLHWYVRYIKMYFLFCRYYRVEVARPMRKDSRVRAPGAGADCRPLL